MKQQFIKLRNVLGLFVIPAMLTLGAQVANAQVKVGSNPTTISTNAVLDVEGAGSTHTVVLQNGYVGINKAAPVSALDIVGQAAVITNTGGAAFVELSAGPTSNLRLQNNNGASFVGTMQAYDFQLYTTGTPRLTVLSTGNVGIGTANPNNKLEITGAANASGLRFTNLTSTVTETAGAKAIGVNASGDVVTIATATPGPSLPTIKVVTAAYTFLSTDLGNIIIVDNPTAVILTVPTGLSAGFYCEIIQKGAGKATVTGASGVTIVNASGAGTRVKNSAIGIILDTATSGFITGDSL